MLQQTICDAIAGLQVISFTYNNRIRTAEPHLLGYDHDGDLTLSVWQLSGGSGKGFRDFHVAKLTGLATTGAKFAGPRPGYNPNDKTIARIVCRL